MSPVGRCSIGRLSRRRRPIAIFTLVEQLASDPGPNEREQIERLLAKIETALSLLEPNDPIGRGE